MFCGLTHLLLVGHSPLETSSSTIKRLAGEGGRSDEQSPTRDGDGDRWPSTGEEDSKDTETGVGEGGRGDTTSNGE